MPERAILYTRISDASQSTYSIETQLDACRAYAAERGYLVIGNHSDGHSAAVYRERPALTELRESVRRGEADVVIAYAIDRISRQQSHLYILLEEFAEHGCRLEFVTEAFEDSAVGRLIMSIRAFVAEIEREKIIERSMRGRLARVQSGKLLAGPRPLYGYQWRDVDKTALDIDPDTAPVVQRIYRDYAAGTQTLRSMADRLTADAIPTPSGRSAHWHGGVVRQILTKPYYTGRAYGWAWRAPEGQQMKGFDAANAIALPEGTIPPLVDDSTYRQVQDRLALNRENASRNNRYPEAALFRGLAFCGHCGERMHIRRRNGQNRPLVYECSGGHMHRNGCDHHAIDVAELDTALWAEVVAFTQDIDLLTARVTAVDDDRTAPRLAEIERETADIERRRANVARAIATLDDEALSAPLTHELRTLGDRALWLHHEHDDILAQRHAVEQLREESAASLMWVTELGETISQLDYPNRRRVLERLGVAVQVFRPGSDRRWIPSIPLAPGAEG